MENSKKHCREVVAFPGFELPSQKIAIVLEVPPLEIVQAQEVELTEAAMPELPYLLNKPRS